MAIGGKKGIRRLCDFLSLVCVHIDQKIGFISFSCPKDSLRLNDSHHVVVKRVVWIVYEVDVFGKALALFTIRRSYLKSRAEPCRDDVREAPFLHFPFSFRCQLQRNPSFLP